MNTRTSPRITVIGTGDVGSTLIKLFTTAGYLVTAGTRAGSESRDSELAASSSAHAVTVRSVRESAQEADVIFLAVPWHAATTTLRDAAIPAGTIVVDTTNFNLKRDGRETDPGPRGTTSRLAAEFPRQIWVKSFNMLWTGYLREDADRAHPSRVVFLAADDATAKSTIAQLIADAGFVAFDNGNLADAPRRQVEGTPGWNQRLDFDTAAELIPDAPAAVEHSR